MQAVAEELARAAVQMEDKMAQAGSNRANRLISRKGCDST